MVIRVVAQKILPSGLILPTIISIRGTRTPVQQFRYAECGTFDCNPYTATKYYVVIKDRDAMLVPGYAGYWQMWDSVYKESDAIRVQPRSLPSYNLREPSQLVMKQYRVWHGPRATSFKHNSKLLEYIEAHTSKDARKKIIEKYPGHVVGHATLISK